MITPTNKVSLAFGQVLRARAYLVTLVYSDEQRGAAGATPLSSPW